MSQNGPYSGPPWPGGSSDEPYSEPSDPWGEHGAAVAEPSWGGNPPSIPQQPAPHHSAPINSGGWVPPPPPAPRKRNTSVLALVVVLGLFIVAGLGTTAWLLKDRRDKAAERAAQAAATSAANPGPPAGAAEDARFDVKVGDCVINQGTDNEPDMRENACTSGTYQVLKRINGTTSGKKDAELKCAKVPGYTKWYFYDSPLDDLDFVLCLKERKAL